MNRSGLLVGKKAICEHLNMSQERLLKFVRLGMPVLIQNGRWLAHIDNLDDWFRAFTRRSSDVLPDVQK